MTRSNFLAALLLAVCAPALAGGTAHEHGHAHEPLHGGVVAPGKEIDYELVARPELIQLHLRDHGKAPVDLKAARARLSLLSGSERQEVELLPAGDRLEARGSFKLGPGTKAVALVTLAGKPAGTLRFALK